MNAPAPPVPMRPAGVGRRAAARGIDALSTLILFALTLAAVGFVLALGVFASAAGGGDPFGGDDGGGFLLLLLLWLPSAWMAVYRYEVLSVARRGQTLGKRLMGICVVRYPGPGGIAAEFPERRSSRFWARWALPHLVGLVAAFAGAAAGVGALGAVGLLVGVGTGLAVWMLVYASALWGKDRRGWHDKAAGTMVVRATDEVLERLAAPEPPAREPRSKDLPPTRDEVPQHSSYVEFWDQVWDDDAARESPSPPRPEAD